MAATDGPNLFPIYRSRAGRPSRRGYPLTRDVAQLAGDVFRHWRHKGQTLGLADVTVAAVALIHKLVLVTDNRKHFPMPELQLLTLPERAR